MMSLISGAKLGPYEIQGPLGAGGTRRNDKADGREILHDLILEGRTGMVQISVGGKKHVRLCNRLREEGYIW